MRILQLVEAAGAGVGRHGIDLTEGLLCKGHDVHLLYSPVRADGVFSADVLRLRSRLGLHVHEIPMRRGPSVADGFAIRELRRYLRLHGPFDLIHCHSTKAGFLGRLGLIGVPAKRLYTPHMFFTMLSRNFVVRRLGAALECGLSNGCDGIIAVSREEYQHALDLGISSAKLSLVPNGVRLPNTDTAQIDRIAARRQCGLLDDETCIGFVGRLAPQKSPETMLRSFAALRHLVQQRVRLVMIGDGPLAAELRALAIDLGIEPFVTWLGQRDAKPLMCAFDIFALTSDSEGHPIVVLEAMSRGLPIVATAVGGVADTVQPGVNGFIVPVRGVREIADAIAVLVQNPDLRTRMGEASRRLVQAFSIDRMVDQTVRLYEEVVARKTGAAAIPPKTPNDLPNGLIVERTRDVRG